MSEAPEERSAERIATSGGALLRGSAGVLALHGVGMGLGFGLQVLLARLLGAAAYGDFAWVAALFGFGVFLAQAGVPTMSVRFAAAYREAGALGRLRGLLRVGTRSVLVTSAATALLGLAAAALAEAFGAGGARSAALAVAALVVPLGALQALEVARLRGLGSVVASQIPFHVVRPLVFAALLLLSALVLGERSAAAAIAALGGGLLAALLLGRSLRRVVTPRGLRDAPEERETRTWLRVAAPLAGIGVLQILWQQGDVMVLGALRPGAEVGPYAAAVRVGNLLTAVLVAVGAWSGPRFAALFAREARPELERLLRQTCRLALLGALPAAAALLLLAEPVLRLFGPAFPEATPALAILLVGQLVSATLGPVGHLLSMTGQQDAALAIEAGSAAVALGLTLLLAPGLGAEGAALAATASVTLRSGALALVAWRRLGVRSLPF